MKGLTRDERGAGVLALVLILLVMGGLVLTPLLGLMGTGLGAGQVYERKTDELYAADAGVEEAVWRIQVGNVTPPSGCNATNYWVYNISSVNGKKVVYNMTWTGVNNRTCLVVSTATGNGSSTTVESYVEFVPGIDLSFAGGALISKTDIELVKNLEITGDVYYCGENTTGSNVYIIDGKAYRDKCPLPLPTPEEDEELAQAFKERAMGGEPPYEDDMVHIDDDGNVVIDRHGSANWGPTYIAGDLTIGDDVTITLGPTYITGNLTIGGSTTVTLGGILYVEGWINAEVDCEHGGKSITFTGTGAIIAGGDICFGGLADYTLTDGSVIMSLNGDIVLEKETEGDEIHALIYAPKGHIEVRKHFSVYGQVIGNSVSVQESHYFYEAVGGSDLFEDLSRSLIVKTYEVS